MQLYIIRHAQSSNNALADQRFRVHDPHLTELGFRQAKLLAQHLVRGAAREASPADPASTPPGREGLGIARLYCSPMIRALQTALPAGRALGLQPEVWVDIHECGGVWLDHGDENGGVTGYPGCTRSEISRDFPDFVLPDAVAEGGWWRGGHEEEEAWEARARRVAEKLMSWAARPERIALITHGAFSDLLLHGLWGSCPSERVYYHLDNTSISLVAFRRDGSLSLRYLNRLDHLPPEAIT